METSSKTCVAVDTEQATLFVALELSQATWLVGLHSPIADKISINRIDGGDTDKLLALIEKKREQAARQLGRPVRVVSCYEAGRDGFWLHRFLIGHGIDNRVLDSASILVDRRARRAKTDRLDAAALLRVLMALVRGEEQVCRVVQVPSIAQEDERRLSRERERLLHERNSHIARIKGPAGIAWRAQLQARRGGLEGAPRCDPNGQWPRLAGSGEDRDRARMSAAVVGQGDARRGGAGDRADDRAR
jgi:transposase